MPAVNSVTGHDQPAHTTSTLRPGRTATSTSNARRPSSSLMNRAVSVASWREQECRALGTCRGARGTREPQPGQPRGPGPELVEIRPCQATAVKEEVPGETVGRHGRTGAAEPSEHDHEGDEQTESPLDLRAAGQVRCAGQRPPRHQETRHGEHQRAQQDEERPEALCLGGATGHRSFEFASCNGVRMPRGQRPADGVLHRPDRSVSRRGSRWRGPTRWGLRCDRRRTAAGSRSAERWWFADLGRGWTLMVSAKVPRYPATAAPAAPRSTMTTAQTIWACARRQSSRRRLTRARGARAGREQGGQRHGGEPELRGGRPGSLGGFGEPAATLLVAKAPRPPAVTTGHAPCASVVPPHAARRQCSTNCSTSRTW